MTVLDRLLPSLQEAETFSKPGTADVTPSETKKIAPLAKHFLKMAHPFTACVAAQRRHNLSEGHAKRRCAVLLDKFDPKRLKHSRVKEDAEDAYDGDPVAEALLAVALDSDTLIREANELVGPLEVAELALSEAETEEALAVRIATATLGDLQPMLEAALTSAARKKLSTSAFVFPKERRYPIHDLAHARNALARSAGKPEEGTVRAAVHRRYPELKKGKVKEGELEEALSGAGWAMPSRSTMRAFRSTRRAGWRETRKANRQERRQGDPDFEKKHPRGKGEQGGQFITKGSTGLLAKPVARKLGVKGGTFTKKDIRQYQRRKGLVVDGKIGSQTASSLLGVKSRKPGRLTRGLRRRLTSGGRVREEELVLDSLAEFWDPENLPRDALGRQARKLSGRGALYLGAGVGAAKKGDDAWVVTDGSKEIKSHGNPLTATAQAFELAGGKTDPESPGGTTQITSAAIAARVVELESEEADLLERIRRADTRVRSRLSGLPIQRDDWETRNLAENRSKLRAVRREKRTLLRGPVTELSESEILAEMMVQVEGYSYRRGGKTIHVDGYFRDAMAQVAAAVGALRPGEVAHLPEGFSIRHLRDDERKGFGGTKKAPFRVDVGHGPGSGAMNAREAASRALRVSATSTKPRSFGGAKRHPDITAAKAAMPEKPAAWGDPGKTPDAVDELGMGKHPLAGGGGRGEREPSAGGFSAGDKVRQQLPNSGLGTVTFTVDRIEGDEAIVKFPPKPSQGGGRTKRVPVSQLRRAGTGRTLSGGGPNVGQPRANPPDGFDLGDDVTVHSTTSKEGKTKGARTGSGKVVGSAGGGGIAIVQVTSGRQKGKRIGINVGLLSKGARGKDRPPGEPGGFRGGVGPNRPEPQRAIDTAIRATGGRPGPSFSPADRREFYDRAYRAALRALPKKGPDGKTWTGQQQAAAKAKARKAVEVEERRRERR